MVRRLKRIEPIKFGMVAGIVYGLISLIFVPFFLLFAGLSTVAAMFGNHSSSQNVAGGVAGVVICIIFAIFIPVFYAVIEGLRERGHAHEADHDPASIAHHAPAE